MGVTIHTDGDEGVQLIVNDERDRGSNANRSPVHVVYGGADRYSIDTPEKFGRIAVDSVREYAADFATFARAFQLAGSDQLPTDADAIEALNVSLKAGADKTSKTNEPAWFAWTVYQKTLEKLQTEPVEDFRIDFEDGYGFRSDEDEDRHAVSAASNVAKAFNDRRLTIFSGFRIKSFAPETYSRATRTLDLFLTTLLDGTGGKLPENFVVTLPKVTDKHQVKDLAKRLSKFEEDRGLTGKIGIELMIETPGAIFNDRGRVAIPKLLKAARGRCASVHFGAYDYTAALGISASFQDIRHPACGFARSVMQAACASAGVRVVDSVTTQMPIPLHRGDTLTWEQEVDNSRSVHAGWFKHFQNVSASMAEGFYQSWDLHPNQLVARYAAVYSFFLSEMELQAARLKTFLSKATQASLTGNTFDDAASAHGILNFFRRGLDCGAFSNDEVRRMTGLEVEDLSKNFSEIADRLQNHAPQNERAGQARL